MQNQLVYNTTTKNQEQYLETMIFNYFINNFNRSVLYFSIDLGEENERRFMMD